MILRIKRFAFLLTVVLIVSTALSSCARKPTDTINATEMQKQVTAVSDSEQTVMPDSGSLPRKSEKDEEIVAKYSRLLSTLPVNDEKSIPMAMEEYRALIGMTAGPDMNDKLFRKFESFYYLVQSSIKERMANAAELRSVTEKAKDGRYYTIKTPDKIANENLRKKASGLIENGFAAFSLEGDLFLGEDPEFLLKNFSGTITQGMTNYLELRSTEQKNGAAINDAGFTISWDAMSDRIIEWESYARKYAGHPEAEKAQALARKYLKLYTVDLGLDNSPMFKNKKLVDPLKKSYERFIEKHAASAFYPIIDGYFAILKKNNLILTDEAKEFLDEKGLTEKTDTKEYPVLSVNKVYGVQDSAADTVIVRMVDGKHYNDVNPGPFQGWNYEGKFSLETRDYNGKLLSAFDLNSAFDNEPMVFKGAFGLKFEDYNSDGSMDFTIGQYGSSNGYNYKVFSIRQNGTIICLLLKGGNHIYSSQKKYSTAFQKVDGVTFKAPYYDNTRGKSFEAYYKWSDIQSCFERNEQVGPASGTGTQSE